MNYKEIIEKMYEEDREFNQFIPPPATEDEIAQLKKDFQAEFSFPLPEFYCDILRITNGLNFNGLTIWPTRAYGPIPFSLIEENRDSHLNGWDEYLYFANLDADRYVYNLETKEYQLVDFAGHSLVEVFPTCKEMLEDALRRAYN